MHTPRFELVLALALLSLPSLPVRVDAADAGQHRFAVEDWLRRPGVKTLAVEFFASWCKPCMESVPKWRALREKYGPLGFRLVVVSTRDPEGGCVNPGWSPDEIVCDDDGRIASAFGISSLPAADLFTWQGRLAVQRGHVEDVEARLKEIVRGEPRVEVEVGALPKESGITASNLAALVRARLANEGKLLVVADESERKKLAALKKRSFDASYDDALECAVGRDVSANSLLRVLITPAPDRRILFHLLSVERGCLEASASAVWTAKNPAPAIAEAVAALLDGVRTAPGIEAVETYPMSISEVQGQPSSRTDEVIVTFRSTPADAVVLVEGNLLCNTPCSRAVSAGPHVITMQKQMHDPRSEKVVVVGELQLDWALAPNYGKLDVESKPSGATVSINGEDLGRTPLLGISLAPGTYEVSVNEPCHQVHTERVRIARAERARVHAELNRRPGVLEISAQDTSGNEIAADVYARGEKIGRTPGLINVAACKQTIEARDDEGRVWSEQIAVRENETTRLMATLTEIKSGAFSDDDTVSEKDHDVQILKAVIQGLTAPVLNCTTNDSPDLDKRSSDLQGMFTMMSAKSDARPAVLRQIADCSLNAALTAKSNALALVSIKRAITHLEILLHDYPKLEHRDEVLATIGWACGRIGDFERSRTYYRQLFSEYRDSYYVPRAHLALARQYDAMTNRDRSYMERAYLEYSAVSPFLGAYQFKELNLYARFLRARLLARMGHEAQASSELKQIVDYCHDHPLDVISAGLLRSVEREMRSMPVAAARTPRTPLVKN